MWIPYVLYVTHVLRQAYALCKTYVTRPVLELPIILIRSATAT